MDVVIAPGAPVRGRLTAPSDKAIGHRAALVAALAEGETLVGPWPEAEDCQRTLALVQGLGAAVRVSAEGLTIVGRGAAALRPGASELACGESGTTMRLAAGVLAGVPGTVTLTAGPSLSRRPMRRIVEPLAEMGARMTGTPGTSAGSAEVYPPLVVHGARPLKAIRYEMPVASAQVKSAILLAGLQAGGRTTVVEPSPSRDHTERLLRQFGARVSCRERVVALEPGRLRSPGRLALPGDVSSAAFFIVAACAVPGSRLIIADVGLNPTRVGFLELLGRMGARIRLTVEEDGWEPRGAVAVEAGDLHGIDVAPGQVPGVIDELPALMVAAAVARGATRLHGLAELRVKETDRIRSMVEGLRGLGVTVREPADDVVELEGGRLSAGTVSSAGDHRTAMSLAVAGLLAAGPCVIRGAGCVAKSFPSFFDSLRTVTNSATVKTVDNG